jgi:transcription initiation factor IIF auxiliary subunit
VLTGLVIKKPPFRIEEKGWGEFDMQIVLSTIGKGGDHTLEHDLNFQSERYEAKHQVVSAVLPSERRPTDAVPDLPESQARAARAAGRVRIRRRKRRARQGGDQEEEPQGQERRYGEARRRPPEAQRGRPAAHCHHDPRQQDERDVHQERC